MNWKKRYIATIIGIFSIDAMLIIFMAEDVLTADIWPGRTYVPMLLLVGWTGLISYTLILQLIMDRQLNRLQRTQLSYRVPMWVVGMAAVMATAWGLVTYYLFGNWNFMVGLNEESFKIWQYYTAAVLFIPIVGLVLLMFQKSLGLGVR